MACSSNAQRIANRGGLSWLLSVLILHQAASVSKTYASYPSQPTADFPDLLCRLLDILQVMWWCSTVMASLTSSASFRSATWPSAFSQTCLSDLPRLLCSNVLCTIGITWRIFQHSLYVICASFNGLLLSNPQILTTRLPPNHDAMAQGKLALLVLMQSGQRHSNHTANSRHKQHIALSSVTACRRVQAFNTCA